MTDMPGTSIPDDIPDSFGQLFGANVLADAFAKAANLMSDEEDPYLHDPVGWVRNKLGEHLWSKQIEVFESIRDNRYTAVHSCHDSGKSFTASRAMAWWIAAHKQGEAFVVSTAPTTPQVEAILWRELGRAHRKGELPGKITLDAKWRLDTGEMVGYGRKPNDYNPDAFQGIHQRYVLVVIDEANGIPKMLYDAVDSLATNANARVLAIGNPDNPASQFAEICKPGSGWNVIHINGLETPNFTEEWVPNDLRENLLSPEWVEERRRRWGAESPLFVSKVLGQFPKIGDDTLIPPHLILAAQNRALPTEGIPGQLGVDVARYGQDETVLYLNRSGNIRIEARTHHQDTMQTAGLVAMTLEKLGYEAPAIVDEVGVGAGVVDRLREQNLPVSGFSGGSAAVENDRYVNARSEAYWHFREMFEEGMVDLDPQDEQLAAELGNLKWRVDSKGRILVEPKDEYKKRLRTNSPDRADAACYSTVQFSDMIDFAAHRAGETMTHDMLKVAW